MRKVYWRMGSMLLAALTISATAGAAAGASATGGGAERRTGFGTITGTVLDGRGKPLAGALVTVLRDGLNEVVRETRSAADGTFAARVTPGRYLIRALADGFTPATFSSVQIESSSELVYRFNLQPAGEGRTAPERRADRHDPKFKIRSSQSRRSIFQASEGEDAVLSAAVGAAAGDEEAAAGAEDPSAAEAGEAAGADGAGAYRRRPRGVVETFYAASANPGAGTYGGVNFAVAAPVSRQFEMIFAGQLGEFERFEATARVRAGDRHRLTATLGGALVPVAAGAAKLSKNPVFSEEKLGQFSVRAVDEWVVREGVVVVLGLDYSRFVGAGDADSLSPRLGFAFDAGARTRLRAAYAPGASPSAPAQSFQFEDGAVLFREPPGQAVALVEGRPVMERSRRLEFGVERVLDENSSVEATIFFDTTDGRGVGLLSVPLSAFSEGGGAAAALSAVASQQGGARGVRVVYTRRLTENLRASAGYSFGRGQELSPEGIAAGPDQLFQDASFQTAAAQLDASLLDGTHVRTVLRFSPRAAVFAIDPFAGRLAVYDPSLSILVTQELPSFGLPVRAEATLDARNLLDVMTGVEDGESLLSIGAARRTVRGGISFRF